jgi:site-specific DNA-cytosine methylase
LGVFAQATYAGLDLAVHAVLNGDLAWVADNDPGASAILAHRFPDVPNLGDIKAADWGAVEPVDVLTAGFPCFPAGTLVTTDAGLRPIEDLKVGDQVLTHQRRYRPVIQTMRRDAERVHVIKAMGAPDITTTDEHPFYVKRDRNAEPEWVAAKDLRYGMYLALPDTDASQDEASEAELSRWYLVGRWLGDGWTVTHKRTGRPDSTARRVHWCCSPEESDTLEKAFGAAGLHPSKSPERTVVKYVMQSVEWADLLGRFGKYAYGKHIPEYVHALPVAIQSAMLRGWLDSDGDVKADGALNGTTTSRALAVGMARVARTVHGKGVSIHAGGSPRQSTVIEGRRVNERPWWNVRIPPGPSKRAFQRDGFTWVPFRSADVRPETTEVFNIGVSEDESYVAEGVTVHNCQDVSCAGARKGLRAGNRTGVWSYVARAIGELRPSLVVLENVRGLLSAGADSDMEPCPWCVGDSGDESALRALGAVLGDLADLGFDAEWTLVSAADAGAPHRRERVFILAWPAADARGDEPGGHGAVPGDATGRQGVGSRAGDRLASPDAPRGRGRGDVDEAEPQAGREPGEGAERDGAGRGGGAPENPDRAACDQRRQPAPGQAEGGRPRSDAGRSGGAPAADADGEGRQGPGHAGKAGRGVAAGDATADAERDGLEGVERFGQPHAGRAAEDDRGRGSSGGDLAPSDADESGRGPVERNLRAGEPDASRGATADSECRGLDRRPQDTRGGAAASRFQAG